MYRKPKTSRIFGVVCLEKKSYFIISESDENKMSPLKAVVLTSVTLLVD